MSLRAPLLSLALLSLGCTCSSGSGSAPSASASAASHRTVAGEPIDEPKRFLAGVWQGQGLAGKNPEEVGLLLAIARGSRLEFTDSELAVSMGDAPESQRSRYEIVKAKDDFVRMKTTREGREALANIQLLDHDTIRIQYDGQSSLVTYKRAR